MRKKAQHKKKITTHHLQPECVVCWWALRDFKIGAVFPPLKIGFSATANARAFEFDLSHGMKKYKKNLHLFTCWGNISSFFFYVFTFRFRRRAYKSKDIFIFVLFLLHSLGCYSPESSKHESDFTDISFSPFEWRKELKKIFLSLLTSSWARRWVVSTRFQRFFSRLCR